MQVVNGVIEFLFTQEGALATCKKAENPIFM